MPENALDVVSPSVEEAVEVESHISIIRFGVKEIEAGEGNPGLCLKRFAGLSS